MRNEYTVCNFTWMDPNDNINILHKADDSSICYVLELDVEYPHHLHDLHSDIPFLPNKECVKNTNQIN